MWQAAVDLSTVDFSSVTESLQNLFKIRENTPVHLVINQQQ